MFVNSYGELVIVQSAYIYIVDPEVLTVKQTILFDDPEQIWFCDVIELPNGDLVTTSNDQIIKGWSRDDDVYVLS